MAKSDKTVIISRKDKYENGEFAQFSKRGFALAAQTLSKNGLILWMYLCENKNGYKFTVSQTGLQVALGLTEGVSKSMTKAGGAFDELKKYGFIKDGIFYADGPEEEKLDPAPVTPIATPDPPQDPESAFKNDWGF